MDVQGNGMLARAFAAIGARDDTVTIFAKGVADSRTTSIPEFDRESRELERAVSGCLAAGRTLVYLSGGGAIYGRRASLRHEDDVLLPETSYGRHQVGCEQAITSSGVGYLIARIPNAVGHPQRPAQLVPALVRQVKAGRVSINPGASRDLIDAADVAVLVSALIRAGARNVTVNVASGISTEVRDLVSFIERLLETTAERVALETPPDPQRFAIDRLQSYLPDWRPSPEYPFEVLERHVRIAAHDHS